MKRFNDFARRSASALFTSLILTTLFVGAAFAQTTAFTYQGRFTDSSPNPPSNYTMTFRLYDTDGLQSAGNLIATQSAMVSVVNGIFTVKLDFGAAALNTSQARYLEIQVGSTTLTPRQEIVSTPFSLRATNAGAADALSSACVSCVTNAQINSVDGGKITGTISNATVTNATNASNLTTTLPISKGGTGSTTQNFVDLSSNQTVGGSKTFSGGVTVSGGALTMNDNLVRLRSGNDNNHGIIFNAAVDGLEFRGFTGFRWTNGTAGATERMRLDGSGNLTVGGTISGTLANGSVGTAQVADGSLRLTDISVAVTAVSLPQFVVGAHGCATLNGNFSSAGAAVGDVVTLYPPNNSPAGIYIQPMTITDVTAVSFNFCNTLNTNITFPASSVRAVVMRP